MADIHLKDNILGQVPSQVSQNKERDPMKYIKETKEDDTTRFQCKICPNKFTVAADSRHHNETKLRLFIGMNFLHKHIFPKCSTKSIAGFNVYVDLSDPVTLKFAYVLGQSRSDWKTNIH